MQNFYTVKKTIGGVEYTAQFNGIAEALRAVDESYIDGTENTSVEKLYKYLFDCVIVSPKLSLDDFGKDKIGKAEKKQIGGKEYTAKFGGVLCALRAIDESYIDGTGNTSTEKLTKYLLENVIVQPENLSPDDFETMRDLKDVTDFAKEAMNGWGVMKELNEVAAFARGVMQGNFRDKKEQKPAKERS